VTGLMMAVAAGHTVLVPNAELAASLFDAVERAYLESGRDVWPTPRVRDFGSWLKERYAARQLSDAASPRLLGQIDERELWQEVIDSSTAGQDMLEPAGAACRTARAPCDIRVRHSIARCRRARLRFRGVSRLY
jgi:hypothetical protein